MKNSVPPDKSGDNNSLQDEWDTARTILDDTDDRLNDLRKYGFTFVTALLTVQSFLLPSIPSSASTPILTPAIKLAVIGATLVLIVALQIMDRNYQVLEQAAAKRALVIENTLNMELTGVITLRFNQAKTSIFYLIIYFLFILGVAILG